MGVRLLSIGYLTVTCGCYKLVKQCDITPSSFVLPRRLVCSFMPYKNMKKRAPTTISDKSSRLMANNGGKKTVPSFTAVRQRAKVCKFSKGASSKIIRLCLIAASSLSFREIIILQNKRGVCSTNAWWPVGTARIDLTAREPEQSDWHADRHMGMLWWGFWASHQNQLLISGFHECVPG